MRKLILFSLLIIGLLQNFAAQADTTITATNKTDNPIPVYITVGSPTAPNPIGNYILTPQKPIEIKFSYTGSPAVITVYTKDQSAEYCSKYYTSMIPQNLTLIFSNPTSCNIE